MSYAVEFAPEATAALKKLTKATKQQVSHKINWLAENFEQIAPQPLGSELSGYFKLRVGNYRVIYEFDTEAKIIFIDKIGHRSEVYG